MLIKVLNKHRQQLMLAIMFALFFPINFAVAKNNKIIICHIPPGNPENAHEIEISESAWPAHEAHGDIKGPCPPPSPNNAGEGESSATAASFLICGNGTGPGREVSTSWVGRTSVRRVECE